MKRGLSGGWPHRGGWRNGLKCPRYERKVRPVRELPIDEVICADCMDPEVGLPSLPEGCVDAVITDPPYGIPQGSAFVRKGGRDIQEWGDAVHNVAPPEWLAMVPFAENAYCLEFTRCHPEAQSHISERHEQAGLVPWHVVLIVKAAPAPTPRPKFVNGYEAALVSYKGKRQWFGGGYVPDRWIGLTPNRRGEGLVPTQKPLEPLRQWMDALCPPGGLVLDPFMGSGTTAVAAIQTGRRFIGYEIDEGYCEIARRRIAEAKAQPRLELDEPRREPAETVAMEM